MDSRAPADRQTHLTSLALLVGALASPLVSADEVHLQVLDIQRVPGDNVDFRDTRSSRNLEGTLATHGVTLAASGNPYAETGSTVTLSAAVPNQNGGNNVDTLISVEAEFGLNSFAFYPTRLGQLGSIEVTGSVSNAALEVRNGGFGVAIDGATSIPLFARQIIVKAGGGIQGFVDDGYTGSANLSYRFELDPNVTRRVHWQGADADNRAVASAANWLEHLPPDDTMAAVFGKFDFTEQPEFTQSQRWAGLIVDVGEVVFDLQDQTLDLGKSHVLDDEFSISIGEQRFGGGTLRFVNGNVTTDSNILIQTRTVGDAGGSSSALSVGPGAEVDVGGTIAVGKFSGTHGVIAVNGSGANVSALGLQLGVQGGGIAFVENGGRLELEQLLQIAQGPASSVIGQMIVSGVGSHLGVSGPGKGSSAIDIGGANRGVLSIENGASADFHETKVNLGTDGAASNSLLNIAGAGTQVRGGTYNLRRGTTLQVIDSATLMTTRGAGISVSRDALFVADGNAIVTAGNLFVNDGQAQVRIVHGSQFNASGEVRIDTTGSLFVADPGSHLQGFVDMSVNGDLLVGNGATVIGNSLAVGGGGRVLIGNGSMTVNELVMESGALVADTLVFAPPDDDDGGGGEAARGASTFTVLDETASAPSGSLIEINGHLTLRSAARLELDIYSATDFDRLVVNGDLDFDGLLMLLFADSFIPKDGATFDLVQVSGRFAGLTEDSIVVNGLQAGWLFSTRLDSDGALLLTTLVAPSTTVPLPPSLALLLAAVLPLATYTRKSQSTERKRERPKRCW